MRLIVPLCLLGLLSAAHAQEPAQPFYAGASYGAMDYEEDLTILDAELASFSDSTTAWKIYGGYHLNRYLGVEGSYMRSGDSRGVASGADELGGFSVGAKADFRGYSIKAMGYLPMSWGVLFAGLGHYENKSDLTFTAAFDCCGEDELLRSSDRFEGLTGHLGAQWSFRSITMRAEYEWWDFRKGGAEVIGLGAHWQF